jgi:hypothetical protein
MLVAVQANTKDSEDFAANYSCDEANSRYGKK